MNRSLLVAFALVALSSARAEDGSYPSDPGKDTPTAPSAPLVETTETEVVFREGQGTGVMCEGGYGRAPRVELTLPRDVSVGMNVKTLTPCVDGYDDSMCRLLRQEFEWLPTKAQLKRTLSERYARQGSEQKCVKFVDESVKLTFASGLDFCGKTKFAVGLVDDSFCN